MQSNVEGQDKGSSEPQRPLHVAVIMDGNGRWAASRGLHREAGHYAGVATLREVVEVAPAKGIMTLTVYAFSVDNWRRPAAEVAALMTMMGTYLETDLARLVGAGIRLRVIGRRDRLPDHLVPLICHAEMVTAPGRTLDLRVAIDYSGRDSILAAAAACASEPLSRDAISRALANGAGAPDVDLLIRTSGEKRLSDFLLWEAAYAELHFTDRLWPDFTAEDLELALRDFRSRNRRFGGLTAEQPATAAELPTPVAPPRRAFVARALAAFFGVL